MVFASNAMCCVFVFSGLLDGEYINRSICSIDKETHKHWLISTSNFKKKIGGFINELIKNNKTTISSMDVAEMLGIKHVEILKEVA